jgi:carboxyl-terminal processing protease
MLDGEKADSLRVQDTTKYVTPQGKVVYGGGGIMPDVEIPFDTNFNYYYYNRVIRNSILVEQAIDYYNQHRKQIDAYENMEAFAKDFKLQSSVYKNTIAIAKSQDIEAKKENIEKSKEMLLNTFKAELARLAFGEKAYFYVYLQEDDMYEKTVQLLSTN